MKFFLDSAKSSTKSISPTTRSASTVLPPIRVIQNGDKPFKVVLKDIAGWIKDNKLDGYETFPVSVEINPYLEKADEMIAEARVISALCSNFVIASHHGEGITASRKLERKASAPTSHWCSRPRKLSPWQRTARCSFPLRWLEGRARRRLRSTSRTSSISTVNTALTQIIVAALRNAKQMLTPHAWAPTSSPAASPSTKRDSNTLTPARDWPFSATRGDNTITD